MSHDIASLPGYHARTIWEDGMRSLLTRLLSKEQTFKHASAALIRLGLETGSLQVLPSDVEDGDHSALLALLGRITPKGDHGLVASTEAPPAPMSEDEQAIAMFLVEAGCSIEKPMTTLCDGPDAMDLALALNADRFLDRYLLRIQWQSRTIMQLPWLHYAAQCAFPASMDVLLRHGAPVDGLDAQGNSALFHASSAACVKLLLDRGANPSIFNRAGDTVLAHWEAKRKLKGDRLTQMRAALAKARSTLTPAQEFEQLLKGLVRTPKSRLEKEIKRLRLNGSERNGGIGILRVVLDRCFTQLPLGSHGVSGNQCTALLDFVALDWPQGLGHANTAELCDLLLLGVMWPSKQVTETALECLSMKLPEKDKRQQAVELAVSRFVDQKEARDSSISLLVNWLVARENPMLHAGSALQAIFRMEKNYGAHDKLGEACEASWMQYPEHPFWSLSDTIDQLAMMALENSYKSYATKPVQENFEGVMGRLAEHALSRGATPNPALVHEWRAKENLSPRQVKWLEDFLAKVQAKCMDQRTAAVSAQRPRQRL